LIEFIILGFLTKANMTGYDIKQCMGISTSNFIDASFGSIYPALKRLEQKNLIHSKELIERGKIKKVYSITEQGKEEFLKWLTSPIEASKTNVSSALCKIFFYDYLPNETVTNLLNQYIEDIAEFKNNLLHVKEVVGQKASTFELCTLNAGLDYYDFIINWYKNYLDKLNKNNI